MTHLLDCRTQYTWNRSICNLLFNRKTHKIVVTYLTGALYVHSLWFYKHQRDNRVRSKLSVACQRWWLQWRFWFVSSVPVYLRGEEEHKPDPWRNLIERNHMVASAERSGKLLKPRKSFRITLYIQYIQIQYSKIPTVLVASRLILILVPWKLKVPAIYRIRSVIAAFTKPHHFFIPYAWRIQFKVPLLVSLSSVFTLLAVPVRVIFT